MCSVAMARRSGGNIGSKGGRKGLRKRKHSLSLFQDSALACLSVEF